MHPQPLRVTLLQQAKELRQLCTSAASGVQPVQDAVKGDVGKEGFFLCMWLCLFPGDTLLTSCKPRITHNKQKQTNQVL